MTLDAQLLQILVDPEDKGSLWYFADENTLYNESSHRRYVVHNGTIPVLLIDDAQTVDDAEHQRLVTKASDSRLAPTGNGAP